MMRLSLPPQTSMCSTRHTWIVLGFLLKAQRFLCSQIGTRETWNVMYSVVSSREEIQYLFSTQKAGAEEFSSLVTFVLSAWPGTAFNIISLSEICFSQSIYSTQLYGLYKEFWHSHVWSTFNWVCLQGDLCMLCCTCRIESIITRIVFTKLGLNKPKINKAFGVRLSKFKPRLATELHWTNPWCVSLQPIKATGTLRFQILPAVHSGSPLPSFPCGSSAFCIRYFLFSHLSEGLTDSVLTTLNHLWDTQCKQTQVQKAKDGSNSSQGQSWAKLKVD